MRKYCEEEIRLGIVSDIHARIDLLKDSIRLLEKIDVGRVYHAGDIVGYGKNPNEVIDLLRKKKIKGVMGNFNEAVAFNLPSCGCFAKTPQAKIKVQSVLQEAKKLTTKINKAWLRTLPDELRFKVNRKRILIVHATIFGIAQYVYENAGKKIFEDIAGASNADIIICGHTHVPYQKKIQGVHFINPGSISYPRHGAKLPTCAVISIASSIRVRGITIQQ